MSEYLRDKLGYLVEHEVSQTILNNSFIPDPLLDEYTNTFLSFISTQSQLPPISADVLRDDFIAYWKRAREQTSLSLSGQHFGHYKAASTSLQLSDLHDFFQHVASHSRICLSRWCKDLTGMLKKISGNIRVNKLRAILYSLNTIQEAINLFLIIDILK